MGTVRAELAFPLENRGLGAAAVARGVEEAALALGIAPLLDRSTHTLSGGELQRVALGAALVGRPRVALLDEPTSQLDPVAGDELLGVLRRINEEWGTAVVLAEHRLERCLSAADRVVALRDGAVACDADPRGFLAWAGEHAPELQTPGRAAVRARRPHAAARVGQGRAPRAGRRRRRRDRRDGRAAGRGAPMTAGAAREPARRSGGDRPDAEPALALTSVWFEHKGGATVLRGVDLAVAPGRARRADGPQRRRQVDAPASVAAGLLAPTRGKVRGGRVALLLQHPGDYALHDRVGDELPRGRARRGRASAQLAEPPPARRLGRSSASGSRSRSCCTASGRAVVCLDEPTRGMDRAHKDALVGLIARLAEQGSAVDRRHARRRVRRRVRHPHRAARRRPARRRRADRRGARGRLVLRDADRADPGRRGAPARRRRRAAAAGGGGRMSWVLASFLLLGLALAAGLRLVRAEPPERARARARGDAGRARRARADRVRAAARTSSRRPTSCCSPATCSAARPGSRSARSPRSRRTCSSGRARGRRGRWSAGALAGLLGAGLARVAGRELGRVALAAACAVASLAYGAVMNLSLWVTYSGDHTLGEAAVLLRDLVPVRRRARDRQRRVLPRVRAGARARAAALPDALRGHLAAGARRRRRSRWRCSRSSSRCPASVATRSRRRRRSQYLERAQNADGGLGPGAGRRLDADAHGLGGARARGRGGPQPARRRARRARASIDYMTRERRQAARRPRRALAHDPRAARRGPAADAARAAATCSGSCCAQQEADGSFAGLVNTTAFAILALRAAGRPHGRPRGPARRPLHRRPGERRRRLQLRREGRAVGRRRHRRGAAGARRGGAAAARGSCGARRTGSSASQNAGRRLRAPGRREQRAVDRLGGPGPVAAGRNPARVRRGGSRSPARLPALARRLRRRDPLLPHEHADAGLGHRAGADRARGQGAPARPGAPRERRAAPAARADAAPGRNRDAGARRADARRRPRRPSRRDPGGPAGRARP